LLAFDVVAAAAAVAIAAVMLCCWRAPISNDVAVAVVAGVDVVWH